MSDVVSRGTLIAGNGHPYGGYLGYFRTLTRSLWKVAVAG
jgi:hypothetical protein